MLYLYTMFYFCILIFEPWFVNFFFYFKINVWNSFMSNVRIDEGTTLRLQWLCFWRYLYKWLYVLCYGMWKLAKILYDLYLWILKIYHTKYYNMLNFSVFFYYITLNIYNVSHQIQTKVVELNNKIKW